MRIRKPCPGCKEVSSRRAAADVCFGCAQLLKWAAEERERQLHQSGLVRFGLPMYLSYLPGTGDAGRDLERRFMALAVATSALTPEGAPFREAGDQFKEIRRLSSYASSDEDRMARPEVVTALVETWRAIVDAVRAANADGHHDGSRLLVGLATGEVSAQNFNELTIGKES